MNKVIVIGSDHTNTLGVIRSLGENNINPYLIALSDTKLMGITKSKYLKKVWICKNINTLLLTLISEFSNEKEKPIVIPTSDTLAALLDQNYDMLKFKFTIPNINNKQGEIIKYMDKYEQYLLAQKYKIPMAKSEIVNLSEINLGNFNNYPYIIKPIISYKGDKMDIAICHSEKELDKIIKDFKIKNYEKVFIQEFLKIDYECEIIGFSYNNQISMPICVKKIRIWPSQKGSTTFGEVNSIDFTGKEKKGLEKLIKDINFTGVFDIELFKLKDQFYLNEINFRNGGHSYSYGNFNMCYYWYLSEVNKKFIHPSKFTNKYALY